MKYIVKVNLLKKFLNVASKIFKNISMACVLLLLDSTGL